MPVRELLQDQRVEDGDLRVPAGEDGALQEVLVARDRRVRLDSGIDGIDEVSHGLATVHVIRQTNGPIFRSPPLSHLQEPLGKLGTVGILDDTHVGSKVKDVQNLPES